MKKIYIKIIVYFLLIFAAVYSLNYLTISVLNRQYLLEQRTKVQNSAGKIRALIESRLVNNLQLMHGMVSYISIHEDIDQKEFAKFAEAIMDQPNELKNLVAAPDFVMKYVYPMEGNEKIVGIDYRNIEAQWEQAKLARETAQMVIAGPIDLIQGGRGILGRAPVFVSDGDSRKFWGLVSSAIDFDKLIQPALVMTDKADLILSIRGKDGKGAKGEVFLGSNAIFSDDTSIKVNIEFPNGSWQIAVLPENGWMESNPYNMYVHMISVFIFVLMAVSIAGKTFKERELKESERRFKDVVMSSSGLVWEIDTKGYITHAYGKILDDLGYNQEGIIGRCIFDFMSENDKKNSFRKYKNHLEKRTVIKEEILHMQKADGEQMILLRNGVPVFDDSGFVTGYRGVDKDVTISKLAEEALAEREALMGLFFSQSLDGFFFMMLDEPVEWDENTDKEAVLDYVFENQRITRINQAMLDQYRAKEADFLGLTPADFFAHDIKEGRRVWRQFFDSGKLHVDTVEKRFDGEDMVVEGDYICIHDKHGRITGHFGVQRDVTKARDNALELAKYVEIVDKNVITSQTNLEGEIIYASQAFCDISGYTKEELVGENHNIIRHDDMTTSIFDEMWQTITKDEIWHGEIKNRKKDGGHYWVDTYIYPMFDRSNNKSGYMAVRQDITNKKIIEAISVTDRLTGIYNRVKLDEALHEEYEKYKRYGTGYSVILFDIDRFKSVNDTYGHMVGDYVLKELACVVTGSVRNVDTFGRWGGEEFLVICPNTDLEGAYKLAEHLRIAVENKIFDKVKKVTCSFGVAYIEDVSDMDVLLLEADKALYKAKENGRNRVEKAVKNN